ncbi:hypothetical protein [Microbacterium sp. CIAB417]|uniref:DUF6993 domain-containing protein n=1 Tax=Microbacterium sp. CIAB417 TaxID=2860287 RepID=UPI001FAD6D87|nr:hypothetical protein [Microbacterium sp. CIAB417]
MPRRPAAPALRALALSASVLLAVGLVACSPEPVETTTPSPDASADATATPEPAGPVLVPEGTAADNLPLFTAVTEQVWASEQRVQGRAYIDALVAAGFDKAAMQVTADETTVGNPVESLLFSVRWGETECLVGQVGPSTGDPVTTVTDQLAEGRCLIGATRPIDW